MTKDKKAEAIERMELLGLMPEIIKDFEKTGRLYYSERTPIGGILYRNQRGKAHCVSCGIGALRAVPCPR